MTPIAPIDAEERRFSLYQKSCWLSPAAEGVRVGRPSVNRVNSGAWTSDSDPKVPKRARSFCVISVISAISVRF